MFCGSGGAVGSTPVRRLLVNVLSVVSLLVALAIALLWARSYLVQDVLLIYTGRNGVGIHSTGGHFVVLHDFAPSTWYEPGVSWQREDDVTPYGASVALALLRFDVERFSNGRLWVFPQWPLVALALVLPTARLLFRRRLKAGGAGFPLDAAA
jgi:hypothetical protein